MLRAYQSGEAEPSKAYTIDDHLNLAEGSATRALFDDFRREVLSLDPCVSEEFLKLYVAYKAETNFVDAVAQSQRMSTYLEHELSRGTRSEGDSE